MLTRVSGYELWMEQPEHPYVYLRKNPNQIFMKIGPVVLDPAGKQQEFSSAKFGFHPALTMVRKLELDRPFRKWRLNAIRRNFLNLFNTGKISFSLHRRAWEKDRARLERLAFEACPEL